MIRNRKARKGFTLVELLVVVLIIAILAAIALPLYLGAVKDSEKKTARANMQTIANAMQAYRLKNASYTTDLALLSPDLGRNFGDTTNTAGPGNRSYAVTLATGGSTTCDAFGDGTSQTVQDGSFYVTSSDSTDGCYAPGISK